MTANCLTCQRNYICPAGYKVRQQMREGSCNKYLWNPESCKEPVPSDAVCMGCMHGRECREYRRGKQ